MNRILFLVSSMQGGGAERVAALLCNHWVEQGYKVTLMPTFSGRGECVYSLDERVELDYLADRVGSKNSSVWNKLRRILVLRNAIKDISPDIIISFLPHVNVAAIIAAQGLKVPLVVSERTYPPAMPLGFVLEKLRKLTYPLASSVVVQTHQALDWLSQSCPQAKGHVIPNPVVYPLPRNTPELDPKKVIEINRKVVMGVGRLGEEKGFNLLIEAFGILAEKYLDWDLVILGEGAERQKLEQLSSRLGIVNRVYFPGRVGNLSDWYDKGDIFVMSSRFEGFPNSLAEAMAHGLPTISFDCKAGPSDLIRHEIDGFLVPSFEGAEGLKSKMEILMLDGDLRVKMSEASISVRHRFSYETIMKKWDDLLGLGH